MYHHLKNYFLSSVISDVRNMNYSSDSDFYLLDCLNVEKSKNSCKPVSTHISTASLSASDVGLPIEFPFQFFVYFQHWRKLEKT